MEAVIEIVNASKTTAAVADIKFIVPGLVHYEDLNNGKGDTVLIQKPAFDKMMQTIEGKPIINMSHRRIDDDDFTSGKVQGVVSSPAMFNKKWDIRTNSWVESHDGWYHAKGLIWDESTRKNIENGYSVSCAYQVKQWTDAAGKYNNVPYGNEVLDGEYTHIAVVAQPRYEGARIDLLNSKGGPMGIMNLFRSGKEKSEESVSVDIEKSVVAIDGLGDVPVSELVNSYKAEATREATRKASEAQKLSDTDSIEVDGKRVLISELKNSHLEALKNSAKAEEDKAKQEAEAKADEEKKAQAAKETELKNALEKAKEAEETERKNAIEKAKELANARADGGKVEFPTVTDISDQVKVGESRYGSAQ